jgi:hypothetical protein
VVAQAVEHFVTLFNSVFLPQGLALHMSMERHLREYVLWILCVDDETYDVLGRLGLSNVRRLKLSDLETPELIGVKPGRTIGEYCWTLTPFAPRFVLEEDSSVERVTYIDADLWFRKHPKKLFDELDAAGKHVLITDHAYAPEYDQSATSGQYCVQFITFTRSGGERVRKWWEERCIEWCYARFENGKFGDQKYLEAFPCKFSNLVHILQQKEFFLAPWNAAIYPYGPSIIYHFHGARLYRRKIVTLGGYYIPRPTDKEIYRKYEEDINAAVHILKNCGWLVSDQIKFTSILKSRIKIFLSRLKYIFNTIFNFSHVYN